MVKDIIITIETYLLVVIIFWAILFTIMAKDLAEQVRRYENDCGVLLYERDAK